MFTYHFESSLSYTQPNINSTTLKFIHIGEPHSYKHLRHLTDPITVKKTYTLLQMRSRQVDVFGVCQEYISKLQMCPGFNSLWWFEIKYGL